MIDVFNIPSQQQQTFTFYATGINSWQTWNKPRNAKMIQIFCLGGGAAGGTSFVAANSAGAGGGGSGGIVRGLIPAFLLPNTLYIQVGKGGSSPTGTNITGPEGLISNVSLQPSASDQFLICKSQSTSSGGGQPNTGAGAGATISVVASAAFGNLGLFTAIAGVAGSGGVSVVPNPGLSQAALSTNLVTGGAGGGPRNASAFGTGGTITQATAILTTPVSGGVTGGQNGDNGYGTLQPFCGTGGAGGAGITSGLGGAGGDGWYGCGGGGAGGGGTKGGQGGDGLVIITVIS